MQIATTSSIKYKTWTRDSSNKSHNSNNGGGVDSGGNSNNDSDRPQTGALKTISKCKLAAWKFNCEFFIPIYIFIRFGLFMICKLLAVNKSKLWNIFNNKCVLHTKWGFFCLNRKQILHRIPSTINVEENGHPPSTHETWLKRRALARCNTAHTHSHTHKHISITAVIVTVAFQMQICPSATWFVVVDKCFFFRQFDEMSESESAFIII